MTAHPRAKSSCLALRMSRQPPAQASGGGFTGAVSGPVPFTTNGSSGLLVAPSGGGTVQPPLLVTLNVSIPGAGATPASPDSGLGEGSDAAVATVSSITTYTTAPGIGFQVVNLVSANLALLGVGPVGGVSQTGGNVAGLQTVQVTLPTPGSSPIPTSVVSLVTLTRSGELGDLPAPVGLAGVGPDAPSCWSKHRAGRRDCARQAVTIQYEAEVFRKSSKLAEGPLIAMASGYPGCRCGCCAR